MPPHILQIAYYPGLMEARQIMLEREGYQVTSVIGNDQGMAVVGSANFDVIVVGFSAPGATRAKMLRWFKQHVPKIPVVVLLANSTECFPDADCETSSEDPRVWLSVIAGYATAGTGETPDRRAKSGDAGGSDID